VSAAAAAPPAPSEPPADLQPRFLEWLFGASLAGTPQESESRLIGHLDAVITSPDALASLLPRAPAVIPQLLNSLRDESQSADALARRVTRDPNLVVEVIRMANSAQSRAATPVTELAEAVQRLGTDGLRRAILRVVLKPIFDGQLGSLTARCTARLWQHSEAKAAACMQEARARGLDPFEGYLAGLMHNVGWTAALCAIDRSDLRPPVSPSLGFMTEVEARRDRLFALLAAPWQLTESLTALAAELHHGGLGGATSSLGLALQLADHRATLQMVGAARGHGDVMP